MPILLKHWNSGTGRTPGPFYPAWQEYGIGYGRENPMPFRRVEWPIWYGQLAGGLMVSPSYWGDMTSLKSGSSKKEIITGIVRDGAGGPVVGVAVSAFRTSDSKYMGSATTDSDGRYEVRVENSSLAHFVVGYLDATPDKAGTTANTLIGA